MSPLFSLIIPTHNRAHLLPRAIRSVLDQTNSNWQLIIVDDGSTDMTRQVVEDFEDARIEYVFQEHGERSKARNRGMIMAEGQYFCFLDDDDYWLSDHLAQLEEAIRARQFPRAVFRTGMLLEQGEKQQKTPNYTSDQDSHPALFFLQHMAGTHTLCFHRDLLQFHQFDPRWHHFQDTHLLIRVLLDFPLYQLAAYTAVYVWSDQMGSRQVFTRPNAAERTANNVAAIRDLFRQGGQQLTAITGLELERQLVAAKYLDHAYGALQAGKRRLALNYFYQSFAEDKHPRRWLRGMKFMARWIGG